MNIRLVYCISLLCVVGVVCPKVVKYEFDIATKQMNITGKTVTALAVGDQIPAPTIEATVGDTLQVTFNNKMDVMTSIHWHGILLPNDQDGVPYLTTPPIKAHSSFTYRYDITHAGTYWYHSHAGVQEQRGLYGALVFHPEGGERVKADYDKVVVMSDWTNEVSDDVLKNLKKDGDYYALKKKAVQSWVQVLGNGREAVRSRLRAALSRMGPMDISDVGYDAFLSNGAVESHVPIESGKTVRVRLINASASTYFNVEYAGKPMRVVAADGIDIEPINVKRLRMTIAETYDVIIQVPDDKSYELRSTSEDGTGYSSTFFGGKGGVVYAPDIPRPNLFLRTHGDHDAHGTHEVQHEKKDDALHEAGHEDKHHGRHGQHSSESEVIEYMKDYKKVRAVEDTTLPQENEYKEVRLDLTGSMSRYVWSFNQKTLRESDAIMIRRGQNVRFVFNNTTMMHHPLHLHGHFFRVLNGQGDRSPLKHTVNVPAMSTVTIEFEANAEKDWFFHCHNLYHMMSGMTRVISYEDTTRLTPTIMKKISHDPWYYRADFAMLSNMTMGMFTASTTRNVFELEYDYNYEKGYDIDFTYARIINRFFDVYIGGNFEREPDAENTLIFGCRYMLPLLIRANVCIDSRGKMEFSMDSSMQLTDRFFFEWEVDSSKEYRFAWSYEINKKILATVAYDSDYKWGAGIRFRL